MPTLLSLGGPGASLSDQDVRSALLKVFEGLGGRERVLLVPPDATRGQSRAGLIAAAAYEHYGSAVKDVLPALGTHVPMSPAQIAKMYPGIPQDLFREHKWREDVVTIGQVPAEMVKEASDGRLNEPWPAQLNRLAWSGGHDLVLSIGQVVPHEVMGFANHSKNLLIGLGGKEAIDLSHFIGAVHGIERMLGKADNPLRRILNYASEHFLSKLPVVYALTVIGRADDGALHMRGLFVGTDLDCFTRACQLSAEVNITKVERPLKKVVAYLSEEEFRSTWLGNKSIYRTRMAVADDGELIVLAPGVEVFGECSQLDGVIRRHGYRTTPEVMQMLEDSLELKQSLSVAAHLIHGSTEKRFRVIYCPGGLSKKEIEGVGYEYGDIAFYSKRYNPQVLKDGWNQVDGEDVYYISNPALGLWMTET